MTPRRRRRAGLPALVAVAVVLVVIVGAAVVALGRVGREEAQPGGRVTEALVADGPLTTLPAFAATANSRDVAGLLYRGLTRTGADGKPTGELAQGWATDASARTFTFHLRPGLRWSDGVPLTSEDALYTLSVLQSETKACALADKGWAGITASAPDPRTVIYVLPQSSPAFIAMTSLGLLPEHALKPRVDGKLCQGADVPTSGPFRVSRADRTHLVLDRNPHALETPYLDGLDLRLYASRDSAVEALLNGEVDVFAGTTPDEARRVAGAVNRRLVAGTTFIYTGLLFNQKNEVLADDHVRRAIDLAIDRRAIVSGALAGYGRVDSGPVPPAIGWASLALPTPAPNLTAAGKELDAGGWVRKGSTRVKAGKKLQLKLTTLDSQPYSSVAARVEQDLASIGVGTSTQGLSLEALVSHLQSHQFDMALTAVDNGLDPDIYVFWHSTQAGPGGSNYSGMPANATLDKDLEDGRATAEYGARRKAYLDAQKQILDDHAAAFLYTPQALIGVRDTVRGVTVPTGGQRYDQVQRWYVNFRRRL